MKLKGEQKFITGANTFLIKKLAQNPNMNPITLNQIPSLSVFNDRPIRFNYTSATQSALPRWPLSAPPRPPPAPPSRGRRRRRRKRRSQYCHIRHSSYSRLQIRESSNNCAVAFDMRSFIVEFLLLNLVSLVIAIDGFSADRPGEEKIMTLAGLNNNTCLNMKGVCLTYIQMAIS